MLPGMFQELQKKYPLFEVLHLRLLKDSTFRATKSIFNIFFNTIFRFSK